MNKTWCIQIPKQISYVEDVKMLLGHYHFKGFGTNLGFWDHKFLFQQKPLNVKPSGQTKNDNVTLMIKFSGFFIV